MGLLERLDQLDRAAFLAINGLHAPWADAVMAAVSEMLFWLPLYLLFLHVLRRRFGWKGLLWSVPVIALMVWCSDSGSVMLFKDTVQRLRPCHQPALAGLVHTVNDHCGGRFGFVSSHASNHFAIAIFMAALPGARPRWATPALLAWAALIAYSRVYLGVHYPGDVIVGAVYGTMVGLTFAHLLRTVLARAGVMHA
ncbi:MAG: phosphatase PAP2 family protein [Flavobacteriales bacterium]|jgi:undecaprenyl-diphosphatase|nr:phosphatase PAP2 family protein [Flavobacteriales bacterium]